VEREEEEKEEKSGFDAYIKKGLSGPSALRREGGGRKKKSGGGRTKREENEGCDIFLSAWTNEG